MLVLNVGMAISAVSHANHYFVDIIAGVLLAVACIAVVAVATRSPRQATASRMAVTA